MDLANFVLTFGPAGLVIFSIGKRLIMAGRHQAQQRPAVERESAAWDARNVRPALSIHRSVRSPAVRAARVGTGAARVGTGAARVGTGAARVGTGATTVVLPQQHRVALELVPDFEAVKSYLTDHTLTDEEAIELLALARRSSGDDLISANKIRDIVGGNEGKVKAHVAAHRKATPTPRTPARMNRPLKGWN